MAFNKKLHCYILTSFLVKLLFHSRLAERSDDDRKGYGTKLQDALEDFTQNFIPHMVEEEEVAFFTLHITIQSTLSLHLSPFDFL